jgi:hypothetical protein
LRSAGGLWRGWRWSLRPHLDRPGGQFGLGPAIVVLAAGLAVGRSARALPRAGARLLVAAFAVAAIACAVGAGALSHSPLPPHLLQPGWGGVWMLAMALAVSGWPGLVGRASLRLELRLAVAGGIALLGLALEAVRAGRAVPAARDEGSVVLPRHDVDLAAVLPAAPAACRLDDAAPELAGRWGLPHWRTPSQLRLVDASDIELSVWGDLTPAGDSVRRIRQWQLRNPAGARLELWSATEPWGMLNDWDSGQPLGAARLQPVWFAALTRSGTVAASLHPEIAGLDAAIAGGLYLAGGGWAWMRVGGDRALSRRAPRVAGGGFGRSRPPRCWSWGRPSLACGPWPACLSRCRRRCGESRRRRSEAGCGCSLPGALSCRWRC